MVDSFNLLDEAWLFVTYSDGSTGAVGLWELIKDADRIRRIDADSPPENFALHRLLFAIQRRALSLDPAALDPMDAWEMDLTDGGSWADRIMAYLDQHRDGFDLFHPSRPFLQAAGMEPVNPQLADTSLRQLRLEERPGKPRSAFNPNRGFAVTAMHPAEAARRLITFHAVSPNGIRSGMTDDDAVQEGKSYGIGPGPAGMLGGVHLEGGTLHETLLLNHVPTATSGDDALPWEQDTAPFPVVKAAPGIAPAGPAQTMVWQSRRIRLLTGPDGAVTGVLATNGDRMNNAGLHRIEHHTLWNRTEPKPGQGEPTIRPRSHPQGDMSWRGIPPLIAQTPKTMPPGCVEWAAKLQMRRILPRSILRVVTTGIVYGQNFAVVDGWHNDTVTLPAAAVADPALIDVIISAAGTADQALDAVERFAIDMLLAAGIKETKRKDAARRDARADVARRLDPVFREWLADLPADDTDGLAAHLDSWTARVKVAVRATADAISGNYTGSWVAQRNNTSAAEADKRFSIRLYKATAPATV